MDINKVTNLMNEALASNEALFLIDFKVSNAGDIEILVDGDKSVSLDECIRISRHIEHNLDREVDDFSLKVLTPDITKPLVHPRQYFKNIGRTLKVQTADEKLEGILMAVDGEKVTLQWKAREQKPIGKGKQTVTKKKEIKIEDITKAVVKIVYN